jgi:surfactin synthase thioesterase subunit
MTQLFLIHYAGGNRYSFNFLKPYLAGLNVVALELPGRGKRMNEELLLDIELAAATLCNQILQHLKADNYIIYGHSLGAYLGLKVAGMLARIGKPAKQLVVSGNAGPGVREKKSLHLLNDNEFIIELQKLGGMPDGFIDHLELMDIFLPILKKDFELIETSNLDSIPPVNIPIFAMMGTEEETVSEISNWKRFTTNMFSFKVFPGGHFFIFDYPEQIATIIKSTHGKNTVLGR